MWRFPFTHMSVNVGYFYINSISYFLRRLPLPPKETAHGGGIESEIEYDRNPLI